MEKQRIFTGKKSFGRLLILLGLIFPYQLFAQEAVFTAEKNQQFYTNSEILFTANFPDLMPGQIEITVPKDEDGIHFRTMRSSQYYANDSSGPYSPSRANSESGAKIELWFTFSKAGTFTIKPIQAKIRNNKSEIKFLPVTISLNPMDLQPRLVIEFSNKKKIYSDDTYTNAILSPKKGQPIPFRIGIQYAAQLNQFDWKSPENSILSHKNEYDTASLLSQNANSSNKAAKNAIIPIGDYELTVLKAGHAEFPNFTANATAYNGSKITIELPPFWLDIQEGKFSSINNANNKENSAYFSESFDSAFSDDEFSDGLKENSFDNSTIKKITNEDCKKLAELRIKERKNPFSTARKQRLELEKELGISAAPNEFPSYIIAIAIVFSVIFCGFLVLFIIERKFYLAIAMGILLITSIGSAVYSSSKAKPKHGISTECTLSSIPEASAEAQTIIQAGTYVQILEKSGDWCYVKFGASLGWCGRENIYFVN